MGLFYYSNMRIIEEHFYDNNSKSFKAWEMTVGQYERFLVSPEEIIKEILTEFQKEVPGMNEDEMKSFLEWLTPWSKTKVKTPGGDIPTNDFHISKGFFMHYLHQPYWEIDHIPMREFLMILEDLPIILGNKEYDPNRKSERIDGEAIRELKKSL